MNIFIANESFPWVTPELRTSPLTFKQLTTTYQSFGFTFHKKKSWSQEVYSLQAKSSLKALELLHRKRNPCYCHGENQNCDALYSQWLFNIFTELTLLELTKLKEDDSAVSYYQNVLKELVKNYYQNIVDLQKIEKTFDKVHREVFSADTNKYFKAKKHPQMKSFITISEKKQRIENLFPEIIKDIMFLYSEVHRDQVYTLPSLV